MARQTVTVSASDPPCSSGKGRPNSPRSAIFFTTSIGSSAARSRLRRAGRDDLVGEAPDDVAELLTAPA